MTGKIHKKSTRNKAEDISLALSTGRNDSSSAYEKDFYKWTADQSGFLKKKEFAKLDIENLMEEIEALGRSEKRTLESFIKNLLLHLLKIKYQPSYHTSSWDNSIKIARIEIFRSLKENPSLKPQIPEIFKDAYRLARLSASSQTGIDEKVFSKECPWTIEECMNESGSTEKEVKLKSSKKKKP